eukprot:COSAG04_NODE_11959_length_678_cov_0.694301_1_plen_141_part_10
MAEPEPELEQLVEPEPLDVKTKGEPFRRAHVGLSDVGAIFVHEKAGGVSTLVECSRAGFVEPPAKYDSMLVLALQEPGAPECFLRFESEDDMARWEGTIQGTMVQWPELAPLPLAFMGGEAEEPCETEEPITDADFDAALA